MTEINWKSRFVAVDKAVNEGLTKLLLRGILLDSTENKNQWVVEKEDFEFLAKDFIGKQLRTDHAEKVSNVLGKVIDTEVDSPHLEEKAEWDPPNPNFHIHFAAEIATKDNNLIVPIEMRFVDFVSPAIDARSILCSKCREPMEAVANTFVKHCNCEDGVKLLKDVSARELSLVASPAYAGTVVVPYTFSAAVNDSLMDEKKLLEIVSDELTKRNVHSSQ